MGAVNKQALNCGKKVKQKMFCPTSIDNTKRRCSDCGKTLQDVDETHCMECRLAKKQKAKDNLVKIGKVIGVVAAVAGTVYLAGRISDGEGSPNNRSLLDDESEKSGNLDYPICDACGSQMTEFDGCWWYACPECGNRIRQNSNGTWTWARDIFDKGRKRHNSDFGLADFCRGGELTED